MKILIIIFCYFTFFCSNTFAFSEHVNGLEYSLFKVLEFEGELDNVQIKKYDVYEFYVVNKSDVAYSIPGYSIDVGIAYADINSVKNDTRSKKSKKILVANFAADVALYPFGGSLIKEAAKSTVSAFTNYSRMKNRLVSDSDEMLSNKKTYILYPGDSKSLYFLVNKNLEYKPASIKFICHDEVNNINHVVINNHLSNSVLNVNAEITEPASFSSHSAFE